MMLIVVSVMPAMVYLALCDASRFCWLLPLTMMFMAALLIAPVGDIPPQESSSLCYCASHCEPYSTMGGLLISLLHTVAHPLPIVPFHSQNCLGLLWLIAYMLSGRVLLFLVWWEWSPLLLLGTPPHPLAEGWGRDLGLIQTASAHGPPMHSPNSLYLASRVTQANARVTLIINDKGKW